MKANKTVIMIFIADFILFMTGIFLYVRQDRVPPVIIFSENTAVYEEAMELSALLSGVTANDNVDGDVSESLLIEKISETSQNTVIVTYAALDRSNNVSKASRIFPAGEKAERSQEADRTPEPGEVE